MAHEEESRPQEDAFSLPPASGRMKAFSLAVFFFFGFALGAFVFWNPFSLSWLPGGSGVRVQQGAERHGGQEAHAHLYTCPMHPEVVEKEPGTCPICQMKLVPLEQEPKDRPNGSVQEASRLWTCPMHPEVVEKEPGTCPICQMELVPLRQETDAEAEGGVVRIDPAIVQQIGVRTESVRIGALRSVVRTVGILDYNEKKIFLVNTKFDGWVEKVYVNYIGERVRKRQKLFEIYSPELVSTQEEYLTALRYLTKVRASGSVEAVERAEALLTATRDRLAYWDITEGQIDRLERTGRIDRRLAVVSPVAGVVIEKTSSALEGIRARAGMNLYRIADLSTVWVHADIYESELPWVRPGLEATITLPYFPGEEFRGEVLFLQPFFSDKTRTVKACIEIENPKGRLDAGMYADVEIRPVASLQAVQVPEDAVIRTGETDVVFVALGEGRFLPREVELGVKGEGVSGEEVYEVKRGLGGDEKVVVSAQFLLDSESSLQAFLRKLTTEPQDGAE